MVDSKPTQHEQVKIIKNEFIDEIHTLRDILFDVYNHYIEVDEDRGESYDLAYTIYEYADYDLSTMGGKGNPSHKKVERLNVGQNNLIDDLNSVRNKMEELRDKSRGEEFTDLGSSIYHRADPGEDVSKAVEQAIEIMSELIRKLSNHPKIDEEGQADFWDVV